MAKIYAPNSPEISEREIQNMNRARRIAGQTMVLLENKGVLPLTVTDEPLAVYGSGVRRTVKGGTGSGDVNSRNVYNAEQGLEEAGITIASKAWLDRFDQICENHMQEHFQHFMALLQENPDAAIRDSLENPYRDPDVTEITQEDLGDGDGNRNRNLAVYIISRTSGEGSDRRVQPGDYELSQGEIANLKTLTEAYRSVVVVLNVGGVIDTKFLRTQPGIDAILLMGQLGNISGLALADVLTGKVVPSGHLTATWAENYTDYPSADTFGHRNGDMADEYYNEGIFVGYRYFDSLNIKPAYSFGYGISYTTFSLQTNRVFIAGADIVVSVTVKNTGSVYQGRETVQVYVSQPEGRLSKAYQVLAGFAKTKELLPGEEENLTIRFPITSMASYDTDTAAWMLESGTYYIRVGNHSRNTYIAAKLRLEQTVVTVQLKNRLKPDEALQEISVSPASFYTYPGEVQEKKEALTLDLIEEAIPTEIIQYSGAPAELITHRTEKVTMDDVLAGAAGLEDLTAQLTAEELTELVVGSARGGLGSTSAIGAASTACPGAAGDTTSALLESRKVRNLVLSDGPAGLRLSKTFVADSQNNVLPGLGESAMGGLEKYFGVQVPERPADAVDYYQYCTAIPIATALAQSWDMALVEEAGDIVGGEMELFGVAIWLAPGMNIHRNPLCGRNFEYYGEDPLIAGMCAAADTRGVQKHSGRGTCIKHFALNSQEDNRSHNNAHCSERAIREIYLKGFEIAVKQSKPLSLMTSYNLLNGLHTANSYDLVTAILRDEWGFEGLVMTDWGTTGDNLNATFDNKYGNSDAALCIKAGNDLVMPGSRQDVDVILEALKNGSLTLAELQLCAMRVLNLVMIFEKTVFHK